MLDLVRLGDAGAFTIEQLKTQASTAGRLIRPYVPVNAGVFRALITKMTSYSPTTYTDYKGNTLGIEA